MSAGRLSDAGLVALGGIVGTLARYLLEGAIGEVRGVPFGIFAINVSGAFLLGLLVQGLAPGESGRWRATRLLLGTGALGGFTTYSTLAVGTAQLLLGNAPGEGSAGLAALYALATLVLGALASWLGILVANLLRRWRAAGAGGGAAGGGTMHGGSR